MSQEVWWNKKTQRTVAYTGKRNKVSKCNEMFVMICRLDKAQLKNYLIMYLYEVGYKNVVVGDGFVYAKGEIPFCLTAHMDTVHAETVKTTYELEQDGDYIISSPQGIGGDDRCGIYMIMNILKKGFKPYVVFCEDEEIGCVGSSKFIKTNLIDELKECKYIIELDRAGSNDAVFYHCDNPEFTEFITNTTEYKVAYGTCSDISVICPACKVAGVNLSCGYYNPHTLGEFVSMNEMAHTQEIVEKLLNTECVAYEYKEKKYSYTQYYGGYYGNYYGKQYGSWYDDESDDWYDEWSYKNAKKNQTKAEQKNVTPLVPVPTPTSQLEKEQVCEDEEIICTIEVLTTDNASHFAQGSSFEEAWTQFFFNNPTYCFNDVADYDEYWN